MGRKDGNVMEKSNLELLAEKGINVKRSGKTICPECSHTRKKKKDPCLSVNVEEGLYRCHNCGWNGKVFNKKSYTPKPKSYTRPAFTNTTNVHESIVNWFAYRGITPMTINKFKISQGESYFPQVQGNRSCMNFNYFKDGELVNIKYRDHEKNFMLHKGAELILYNIDSIKDSKIAIIVEGECDAMIVDQVGLTNVVSVPNGATLSSNPNLEFLDNYMDYFDDKEMIILATDNDDAGRKLRSELSRRFGQYRCYKVDFADQKDANDYFLRYGGDNLRMVFDKKNLIKFPLDGIINIDDKWDDVEYMFRNGLENGDITGILPEFDKHVSFMPGHTMAITGIPNHGKSQFALMVMACLSVKNGWKWGIFSPEHKPLQLFLAKICEMFLGKRLRKGIGFLDAEKAMARSFIKDHFFFIEPENGDNTIDSVLDKAKQLVMTFGIKGLIMDPWNKFEHKMDRNESETSYISRSLDQIIYFGQTYGVFNIIVAHPTKIKKKLGQDVYEVPTLYDIAGSANWFNKVDWGITFYRDFKNQISTAYVQKCKWEHLGKVGYIDFKYNMNNGRYTEKNKDWDNLNWLAPEVMQGELFNPSYTETVPENILTKEMEIVDASRLDDDEAPF